MLINAPIRFNQVYVRRRVPPELLRSSLKFHCLGMLDDCVIIIVVIFANCKSFDRFPIIVARACALKLYMVMVMVMVMVRTAPCEITMGMMMVHAPYDALYVESALLASYPHLSSTSCPQLLF